MGDTKLKHTHSINNTLGFIEDEMFSRGVTDEEWVDMHGNTLISYISETNEAISLPITR